MTNKNIELSYNENLNNKIISKIGNPFKFENEKLQEFSNRNNRTDHVCEGKKILVIRMLDLAKMYARNNSVVYLTDNEEFHKEFINKINNEKYGGDDCSYLINDWKNLNNFIETNFGGDMKFDVIIGNPPYEGQGNPLYLQILEVCHKIANKIIWLCPSQWIKVYKEKEYIKNVKKNCPLISHIHISNPFENAGLANEIGIYVFGKSDKYENYDEIKMERFTNPVLATSIISKFENYTDNLYNHCKQDNNLDFYVNAAQIRGHFHEGKPLWDWTTLFGTNQRIDYKKEKGSYIFWNFSTENECKNFIASTETDIFMFSIYVVKNHQKNPYCNYELMPWLGDYTKQWTEEEIANELGLTQEEVDYIHEEMKPFGWKAQPKNRKKRKSKLDYFANMQE